jgi:hypothetical protein
VTIPRNLRYRWCKKTGLPPLVADGVIVPATDDIFALCDASVKHRIRILRQGLTHKPRVFFVFLESDSFGAWAFPLDGAYFVAVTMGTVVSIVDFFARVFSVWEVAGGQWSIKTLEQRSSPVDGRPLDAWRIDPRIPTDPTVKIQATLLARQTFNFILDHELAHIALGHCDFTDGRLSPQRVDAAVDAVEENAALTSQAFELQADRFAVFMSFDEVFGLLPSSGVLLGKIAKATPPRDEIASLYASWIGKAIHGLTDTHEQRIFISLLCFFSMFRLFDQHHWTEIVLRRSTHPPSPMRIAFAFQAAVHFIEEVRPALLSAFEQAAKTIALTGEAIFAQALARAPNGTAVERALSSEGTEHYRKLLTQLETVGPRLRRKYRADGKWRPKFLNHLPPIASVV